MNQRNPTGCRAGFVVKVIPQARRRTAQRCLVGLEQLEDRLLLSLSPTTTSLAFSSAAPLAGLPVTLTATVTEAGVGDPTGTVTFYDGAATMGTAAVTTSFGVTTASLTAPAPEAGAHRIRAVYQGDANFSISSTIDTQYTTVATMPGFDQIQNGMSFDASGNLYIPALVGNPTDAQSVVYRMQPNGTLSVVASGLKLPMATIVDGQGNLYVADGASETVIIGEGQEERFPIYRVDTNGTRTLFSTFLNTLTNNPVGMGLAFDSEGELLAAAGGGANRHQPMFKHQPNGTMTEMADFTGAEDGVYGVRDLITDSAGNVYASVQEPAVSQGIWQLHADGSATRILSGFFGNSITVDDAGDFFRSGFGFQNVLQARRDGTVSQLIGNISTALTISFSDVVADQDGNLFILDTTHQSVIRLDRTPNLTVQALTTADVQAILNDPDQGGSVTIQPTSSAVVTMAVEAINGLSSPPPATTYTVTVDLGGGTFTTDTPIQAPAGVTVVIVNGTLVGGSPALIVNSGNVILQNVTATNATNAPTILVNGGTLTVRDSTIEESTGYSQAALRVNGGMVDLGTLADPGGNTFNGNGAGELIRNLGAGSVSAFGNTFLADGVPLGSGFALEGEIYHALDAVGVGKVTTDGTGDVYVTSASGSIQRGVNAATAGATVHVQGDMNGAYSVGTKLLTIAFQGGPTLTLQADSVNPGLTALVVTGTSGDDKIKVSGDSGALEVQANHLPKGSFAPTGRIVVHGLDGDDDIQVGGSSLPAWLYGDDGDDKIKGGAGANVLLGGSGNDMLVGNSGRELLIGGMGADKIVGGQADDILIAGSTGLDASDAALAAILAECTSARSYVDRVRNLRGDAGSVTFGSRANAGYFLSVDGTYGHAVTVFDDGVQDTLTGDSGQDWFLFNADGDNQSKRDKVADLTSAEFADDLDFINS